MKNIIVAALLIAAFALTSCTRTERNVTLGAATGAGTNCGSCRPALARLIADHRETTDVAAQ